MNGFRVDTARRGPDLAVWETDKFKTLTVRVVLSWPLGPDLATGALLTQVLRRGTRRLPDTRRLYARLEELYGADLRAESGRVGDRQVLVFQLEVPEERYLPERGVEAAALELLGDVLLDPPLGDDGFPAEWVEQERANLLQQLDAILNDKAQYAHLRLLELMYPDDPYAWPRIGRRQDLEAVTGEALVRHYRRLLAEAPTAVYAVGQGASRAAEALAARLSDLAGGFLTPLSPPPPAEGRRQNVEEAKEVSQAKLAVGYRSRDSLFTPRATAAALMAGILGGYSHSKLFQNVREKASLAYYAYARFDGFRGALYIHSGIEAGNRARALEIIRAQVEDMADGRFTQDEQEMTVRAMVNQIRSSLDSPARMIDGHVELTFAGRPTDVDERVRAVRAVTRDEVVASARGLTLDAVYTLLPKGEA
jgi:predicted Zn-dependent peptidase